jgi:RNA polymerase-binding transcription factor DksA
VNDTVQHTKHLETELGCARDKLVELDEQLRTSSGTTKETILTRQRQMVMYIQQLEHALRHIEQGTYGVCEICHQPIGPARLTVLPSTSLCVSCASTAQSSQTQT